MARRYLMEFTKGRDATISISKRNPNYPSNLEMQLQKLESELIEIKLNRLKDAIEKIDAAFKATKDFSERQKILLEVAKARDVLVGSIVKV